MQRNIRRAIVGLGAVAVVGSLVAVSLALTRQTQETVEDAGPAPVVRSSPAAQVERPLDDGPFPAFWPASSYEQAQAMQVAADGGVEGWRKDPREVTVRFMAEFAGWKERFSMDGQTFQGGVDVKDPEITGSSEEGWKASVSFRRYRIHNGTKSSIGGTDSLTMIGLEGTESPAWFVSALRAEHIRIDRPGDGDEVGSPLSISGRGRGYEATIVTEVKDDSPKSLGRDFVMGGSTEPEPFSGKITFGRPATPSGILILTPDQGAEGPAISMSIVRLHLGKAGDTSSPGSTGAGSAPPGSKAVIVYYVTQRDDKFRLASERHFVQSTPRIATAALEEMVRGTPIESSNSTPFPRNAEILSITISNGVATVDWSAEVLTAVVGAELEAVGIQSAVWTLTEFQTIKKVRFTVEGKDRGNASNGKVIEDWWGHVGLHEQPFSRDLSLKP